MSFFESLGVSPEIVQAVQELGWDLPRDVQDESIPLILGGSDVRISAETGSGKTAALALPMLQIIHEAMRNPQSTLARGSEYDLSEQFHQLKAIESPSQQCTDTTVTPSPASPLNTTVRWADSTQWGGYRHPIPITPHGSVYYEVCIEQGSIARIGVSLPFANINEIGTDHLSWGYGATGVFVSGKTFHTIPPPSESSSSSSSAGFVAKDIIGILVNFDEKSLTFYRIRNDSCCLIFKAEDILPSDMLLFPSVSFKGQCTITFNMTGPFANTLLSPSLYHHIADSNRRHCPPQSPATKGAVGGIIIAPTFQLCQQLHDEMLKFGKYLITPPITIGLCTTPQQVKTLLTDTSSPCTIPNIIIGTPGHISNLFGLKSFSGKPKPNELEPPLHRSFDPLSPSLSHCLFYTIDEADAFQDRATIDILLRLAQRIKFDRGKYLSRLCMTALYSHDQQQQLSYSDTSPAMDDVPHHTAVHAVQDVTDPLRLPSLQMIICSATLESDNINLQQIFSLSSKHSSIVKLREHFSLPKQLSHGVISVHGLRFFSHVRFPSQSPQIHADTDSLPVSDQASGVPPASAATSAGTSDENRHHTGGEQTPFGYQLIDDQYLDNVHFRVYPVTPDNQQYLGSYGTKMAKLCVLAFILRSFMKPHDDTPSQSSLPPPGSKKPSVVPETISKVLIFCRTQNDCIHVCSYLTSLIQNGVLPTKSVASTSQHTDDEQNTSSNYQNKKRKGSKPPQSQLPVFSPAVGTLIAKKQSKSELDDIFKRFQLGDIQYLVCTDSGARGLDFHDVSLVINLNIPDHPETYIQRAGRTARNNRPGMCLSLVSAVDEYVWFHNSRDNHNADQCENTLTRKDCVIIQKDHVLLEQILAKLTITIPYVNQQQISKGFPQLYSMLLTNRVKQDLAGDLHRRNRSMVLRHNRALASTHATIQEVYNSIILSTPQWNDILNAERMKK